MKADDPVALGVVHIHHGEGETLVHRGGEQQPGAVHGVREAQVER